MGNRGFLIVILLSLFWLCVIIFLGIPTLGLTLFNSSSFIESLKNLKIQELNSGILEKKVSVLIFIALLDFTIRAIITRVTNINDTRLYGQTIFIMVLFILATLAEAINEKISNTVVWPYVILFLILWLMKMTVLATYLETNTIRRSNII
jgi:hypothetical protein